MAAFIIAAIIEVVTILATVVYIFGTAMSDTTGTNANPFPILIGGTVIAVLVAASHWLPRIGW
jgi:hypothetical protein